ncbi:K(+)-transporting ATPase subunit C [Runella slithyformis]|uniref:Potassium-transporting ATPase KdpC subunit n=1 Tax=Runella slithyformis (strain ATCC 29530 / DSM 19594 / LMG 11500 / NCIMB 11436 / LSU 4) TaxID=761193 RepID=A0A7U3ZLI0_RUNSL|nr:K(+)-transporting ATPase subunit C [Runella slithyformis]AEI49415.1 Potassium-transporting ATPase C chain [Runella slithyformis DSM 19594]
MKTHIVPAILMTLATFVLLVVIYPLIVWGFAQFAPEKGRGETVSANGKVVGFARVGQKFTADNYFWSRPSAVEYNAAGSSGSNKGPSNPDYLAQVQARIDTFLVHNPTVPKSAIPSELVTASGSGLDPDLSPQGAEVQVARIAKVRNLPEDKVKELVKTHTEGPFLGLFGPSKVNILALNIALDQLK